MLRFLISFSLFLFHRCFKLQRVIFRQRAPWRHRHAEGGGYFGLPGARRGIDWRQMAQERSESRGKWTGLPAFQRLPFYFWGGKQKRRQIRWRLLSVPCSKQVRNNPEPESPSHNRKWVQEVLRLGDISVLEVDNIDFYWYILSYFVWLPVTAFIETNTALEIKIFKTLLTYWVIYIIIIYIILMIFIDLLVEQTVEKNSKNNILHNTVSFFIQ